MREANGVSGKMNTRPLTSIAPEIFRKRLLIEGYYGIEVNVEVLEKYFASVTAGLGLRTYGAPIIHTTGGAGKAINEGFDGFVPLIDSGIYISVWSSAKFLSTILYTCAEFDEEMGVALVKEFFQMGESQWALF
jgi:S-adenosylmethionine decarboxylase